MEMYADAQTVAEYINAHQVVLSLRSPMKVEPLGKMATLDNWSFGSFGYDVEPKIGLELLPQTRAFIASSQSQCRITSLQVMK